MKDRICTHCYYVGQPVSQGIGSFSVDGLLWMIFFSLSMFSSIFPLMLIPLGWTIYHIAIYNKSTCPKCTRLNMVSLTSRKGVKALKGPVTNVTYRAPEHTEDQQEQAPIQEDEQSRRST